LAAAKSMTSQLEQQLESYEAELATPMRKKLSVQEESRLEELSEEMDKVNTKLTSVSSERAEVFFC
jgi:hypothetical protein